MQSGHRRNGEGSLVREIDALGGLMGRAIDATGIQFKLLNRSRGPAVWSPRAQADKEASTAVGARGAVGHRRTSNGSSERAEGGVEGGRSHGAALEDGGLLACAAVIVTTGTFLNGSIHIGPEQRPSGRAGEPPARELAECND